MTKHTHAATAPCTGSATPRLGHATARRQETQKGAETTATSRHAGCEETARAGPRAPGRLAERLSEKGP